MVRCIAKECKPFFARVKREIDFFCEEETGAAYRGRNPLSVLRQHLTTTSSKSRTGGLRFGLALVYINPTLVLSLGAREDVCPVSTRDKEDDTATSARIKSGADSSDARRRDRSRWKAAMFVCVVWVRVMQIPAGQVTVKVGHQTVDDSGVCFELPTTLHPVVENFGDLWSLSGLACFFFDDGGERHHLMCAHLQLVGFLAEFIAIQLFKAPDHHTDHAIRRGVFVESIGVRVEIPFNAWCIPSE